MLSKFPNLFGLFSKLFYQFLTLSLAEDIKTYRKSKGHSMADVSQLTGIPADRIYKWEKGTKPNDAEDLLKIQSYLRGELENIPKQTLETVPKLQEPDPSPMLILDRLAKALADQAEGFKAQAAAFAAQAEMMKNIENKMAREQTLAELASNLNYATAVVEKLSLRQDSGIKELREELGRLQSGQTHPSGDAGNKEDENGGDGQKPGKRRAGRK